jgi:hypothetical protein
MIATTQGPAWANPEGTPPVSSTATGGVTTGRMDNNHNNVQDMEAEFFGPRSTLDEPVMETIMRDVRSVASKLKVVLLPMDRSVSL